MADAEGAIAVGGGDVDGLRRDPCSSGGVEKKQT